MITHQPATSPTSAAASSTAAAPDKTGWPATFTVGLFAGDDPNKVLNSCAPLAAYLSEQIGIPINIVTRTSYRAVIGAMRASHADAMEIGPFAYILAAQEANAEALAAVVSAPDSISPAYVASATPFYRSVIFSKRGNGITTLADLKGKTFSFVDPSSTSGHLIPTSLLMKNGINPATDLTSIFAGNHRSSVLAVWRGEAAAGAASAQTLHALTEEGQVDGQLVVLATSEPIPTPPFAVRSTLPRTLKAALKDALLSVKEHPEVIKAIGGWYVEATPEWAREFR